MIAGTTWARTGTQNLEVEPLQHWLEGPFGVHNVTIRDCVFHGTPPSPVHTFGSVDVREVNNSYGPTLAPRGDAGRPSLLECTACAGPGQTRCRCRS